MNILARLAVVVIISTSVATFVALTVPLFPGIIIAPVISGALAYPFMWITEPVVDEPVTEVEKTFKATVE